MLRTTWAQVTTRPDGRSTMKPVPTSVKSDSWRFHLPIATTPRCHAWMAVEPSLGSTSVPGSETSMNSMGRRTSVRSASGVLPMGVLPRFDGGPMD
eukprot:scaffold97730_cov43-Phaeocystis_antarctica.AAC.2